MSRDHYRAIAEARLRNLDDYFADAALATRHTQAHARLADIDDLVAAVGGRREKHLLDLASVFLAEGLCQVSTTNYRLAFYALRGFIETTLGAVFFSAAEYQMRAWELGQRDLSWAEVSSDETGTLSKQYIGVFFPGIKDEAPHFAALARRVYRECSEYVHGNYKTHNLPQRLDLGVVNRWHDLFEAAVTVVLFAYAARHLLDLSKQVGGVPNRVRDILQADLGHFAPIRAVLAP